MIRGNSLRQDGEGGFTLIELLITIVILGILSAIVVFSVGGLADRGNSSACKTNVATISTAAEAARANGTTAAYPATITAMVPLYLKGLPGTEAPITNGTLLTIAPGGGASTYFIGYNITLGIVAAYTTAPATAPTAATASTCPAA